MRTVLATIVVLVGCTGPVLADDPAPKSPDARVRPVQLFEPLAVEALAGNAGFFVGVGEFPNDDGVSSLSFATHDAIELAYLFSLELQLIPPKNCHLALGGEPTAEAVKGHLEQLRRAGAKITTADRSRILLTLRQVKGIAQDPSNLLICSFSSHGFQDRADPYVMPSDGVRDLLAETAVPLKTIETMMQDSKAGHRLLLVDACQERVSAKAVGDDQLGQPVPKAFQEALAVPTGQAKFASCSPGEYSFEHGSLGGVGHGVFTYEFLAALRGKADVGPDNIVRLGDVAKAVSMNVTAWSKAHRQRAQTPYLQSPVETLQLPLAAKADDLKTLLAELEQLPTGPLFTPELRRALMGHLEQSNPEDEADRKLLTATKDFAAGRLSAEFFGPYLRQDRVRWSQLKALSIGMQFVLVPEGEFPMGSPETERYRNPGERQHRVRISRPFYLGKYEVTQEQWLAVRGSNPSWFASMGGGGEAVAGQSTLSFPVERVSWFDCLEFCNRLSQLEGLSPYYALSSLEWTEGSLSRASVGINGGDGYRLPTEAEWEYACRSGTTSAFHFGMTCNGTEANVNGERPYMTIKGPNLGRTTIVGQYPANRIGLCDMHGNVQEWVWDGYDAEAYSQRAELTVDPVVNAPTDGQRVVRGGDWESLVGSARSANRAHGSERALHKVRGFRVARSVPTASE